MWLALAFISAFLLGFYDVSKKKALTGNAVIPVLFLSTMFSTLIFSYPLVDSAFSLGNIDMAHPEDISPLKAHLLVLGKSFIVLSSWILGYYAIKHLPITIAGTINSTRPVIVLVGATLIFGERLNAWQWAGILLAIVSVFLLSRSGKKENIDFTHNKWIFCIAASTFIGACSGLYDKFIMHKLNPLFVQSWNNLYQMIIMGIICLAIWYPTRKKSTPFHWSIAIPLISIFISAADFAYFESLSRPEAMISVVSLVRRSSVIISFICGALLFKEKNLRAKAFDLVLILIGMIFIWLGSR